MYKYNKLCHMINVTCTITTSCVTWLMLHVQSVVEGTLDPKTSPITSRTPPVDDPCNENHK